MAKAEPITKAAGQPRPANLAIPITIASVINTCAPPNPSTFLRMA